MSEQTTKLEAAKKTFRSIIYTAALGKDLSKRHHGSCLPELEEIIQLAKAAEKALEQPA